MRDLHAYLGRDDFRRVLGTTSTTDDGMLRRALESVSQAIDDWLDRTFQPYQATRVYTARDAWSLDVDDLLSVTSVKFDQDGDRVYELTLATSDWELGPANAAAERRPYQFVEMQPNGSYRLDRTRRGVQIVGTWGYWQDLQPVGARLAQAADATSTSLALASSTTVQPQQTLLIGSEQVYVNDVTTSSNALVERAANGTSATSHTTSETLSVYRYPAPIVEAAQIQALRIHKRRDAPLGVVAGGLDVTEGVVQVIRLDPDVEQLIKPYRRFRYLGV